MIQEILHDECPFRHSECFDANWIYECVEDERRSWMQLPRLWEEVYYYIGALLQT